MRELKILFVEGYPHIIKMGGVLPFGHQAGLGMLRELIIGILQEPLPVNIQPWILDHLVEVDNGLVCAAKPEV